MGQYVCKPIGTGSGSDESSGLDYYIQSTSGTSGVRCEYEPYSAKISSEFAMYTGLYKGLLSAEAVMIFFCWIITFMIKKDVTMGFVSTILIPLTIDCITSTGVALLFVYPDVIQISWLLDIVELMLTSQSYASEAYQFSFTYGLIAYVFLLIATLKNRKNYGSYFWTFVILTLVLSLLSVPINNYLNSRMKSIASLAQCAIPAVGAISCFFTILFANCCCSSSAETSDTSDPVVQNARNRLNWAFPLLMLSGILSGLQLYIMIMKDFDMMIICHSIFPLVFLTFVLLFLPAYRSVLFCSTSKPEKKLVSSVDSNHQLEDSHENRHEDGKQQNQQFSDFSCPAPQHEYHQFMPPQTNIVIMHQMSNGYHYA